MDYTEMTMIVTIKVFMVIALCVAPTFADQFMSHHAVYETVKNVTIIANNTVPEVVFQRKLGSRIIGGTPVPNSSQYPSYIFTAGRSLCGGTLIHEDIVLTAAHCNGTFDDGVLIGGSKISGSESIYRSVYLKKSRIHPEYDTGTRKNDIMLVKLSSASLTPIQILNYNVLKPTDNETVTVIGYGDTNAAMSSSSPTLLGVDVRIISFVQCTNYWRTSIQSDKQVCAGIDEGGKDSCYGDSGGPLLTKNGEQIGIVSFSNGCAQANIPSVYTRISGYKDFITKGICDLSNNPPVSCSTPVAPPVPVPVTKPIGAPLLVPATKPVIPPATKPVLIPVKNPSVSPSMQQPAGVPPAAPSPTTDGPDSRPRLLRLMHLMYNMFMKIVG